MKKLYYFTSTILLAGCVHKAPNFEVGFTDKKEQANFAYSIQGQDFKVDNLGHNYTLHGQNLNYDQMRDLFFYLSPWAWGDLRNFFLNYCHQNEDDCTYSELEQRFIELENNFKSKMSPYAMDLFERILSLKKVELKKQIEAYDRSQEE